jgi:signal transduction histidine kinase
VAADDTAAVRSPIVVGGRVWGALVVARADGAPCPASTEARLAQFADLTSTAIANADARAEVERLVDEQASLRRVATLVARGASRGEVFRVIAAEVAGMVHLHDLVMVRYEPDRTAVLVASSSRDREYAIGGAFPLGGENLATRVADTGRSARIESYTDATGASGEEAREIGMRAGVATPIMVEGKLWGAIIGGTSGDEQLPQESEYRLEQFAELVATAIANAESRAEADRLAEEQAALRRVATLVAKESPPTEVFAQVAEEVANVFGDIETTLWRDEGDGSATVVAVSGPAIRVGTRLPTDGDGVIATVLREGRPYWIADNATRSGAILERGRELGITSAIGCPVVVGGRLWGALGAARASGHMFPSGTETRLAQFADLVATAIANADARAQAERLSDEQAALRRVATLVARGVEPDELFAAVTQEVARLFEAVEPSLVPSIIRFDPGPEFVLVGSSEEMLDLPLGSRWRPKDLYVSTRVLRTGRSSHVDAADVEAAVGPDADLLRRQGFLYQVGSPIVVEGRLWGTLTMNASNALPRDTGERLESFTELVATAIANAESRAAVGQLAEEQAALRRMATLVAQGASPAAVFDAVAAEMGRLLDADQVAVCRYETGDETLVIAHVGARAELLPVGTRYRHGGRMVTAEVRRTQRPARFESSPGAGGVLAETAEDLAVLTAIGAPIVVEGGLWGVVIASWEADVSPPADTEWRMAQFAELLETAVANADGREQLMASRSRLLTAGDDARRQVVRDLHDGAQQRLVHTVVMLKLAQRALRHDLEEAERLIGEALEQAQQGNEELRELAHGILPAVLSRGGLSAAIDAVVARLKVPVRVDVPAARFDAEVEASAYFIVAEALTNVVKHARATRADVCASVTDGMLCVEVRDDGIGGADRDGHGLLGLRDRATALGGRLEVEDLAEGGTRVIARLPVRAGS